MHTADKPADRRQHKVEKIHSLDGRLNLDELWRRTAALPVGLGAGATVFALLVLFLQRNAGLDSTAGVCQLAIFKLFASFPTRCLRSEELETSQE